MAGDLSDVFTVDSPSQGGGVTPAHQAARYFREVRIAQSVGAVGERQLQIEPVAPLRGFVLSNVNPFSMYLPRRLRLHNSAWALSAWKP
jgi:hypothetical protein